MNEFNNYLNQGANYKASNEETSTPTTQTVNPADNNKQINEFYQAIRNHQIKPEETQNIKRAIPSDLEKALPDANYAHLPSDIFFG